MKQSFTFFLASVIFMLAMGGQYAFAQCTLPPALFIRSNTPANCPSSGKITIGSNTPQGSLLYTIISGPSGAPVNNSQDDSTFNALPAGNYEVKATCKANVSAWSIIPFTIADNYPPITNMNVVPVSNCGSYLPGGTVTATVTGGSLPLEYSIVKSTDPNYPDNQSVYGNNNTLTVTENGTYQVRAKDACGLIYTKSVSFNSLPPVSFVPYSPTNDQPCADNEFTVGYNLINQLTGNTVEKSTYVALGMKLDVYDGAAGPNGAMDAKLNSSPIPLTTGNIVLPISPSKKYWFVLTDACGQVSSYYWDGTGSTTMAANFRVDVFGCGGVSPLTESISVGVSTFVNYPATVEIRNSSNVLVGTATLTDANPKVLINGLPQGTYTVTITDNCHNQFTKSVSPSTGQAKPYFIGTATECTFGVPENVPGTTGLILAFNGAIPDFGDATVTILSGPSQVGVAGYKDANGHYNWMNLFPGDYVFRIQTNCGVTDVPYTFNPVNVLQRSITATGTSDCDGNGTITGTGIFNGAGIVTYSLLDNNDNIIRVAQPGSVFVNVPPGDYKVSMNIMYVCGAQRIPTNIVSNTVTVTNSTAGPKVVKKIGMICEDANGNELSTGSVYLELAGGAPLLLEYKKESDGTWTTYSAAAPTTVTIDGLSPNSTYDIRVTSCGKSTSTKVEIKKLSPIYVTNTLQPCVGEPYTLSVPENAGATYVWEKDGNILATSHDYTISIYDATFDGTYNCTIYFGNCVVRKASVTLSSQSCGAILPVGLSSFKGSRINEKDILIWTTDSEHNLHEFQVEYSINGAPFVKTGTVSAMGNNMPQQYKYVNAGIKTSVQYRLRMVDNDGSFTYSPIIKIYGENNTGNAIQSNAIYPVPFINDLHLNVSSSQLQTATFSLVSTDGKVVLKKSILLQQGAAVYDLTNLNHLPPGVYILHIQTSDGVITEKVTK